MAIGAQRIEHDRVAAGSESRFGVAHIHRKAAVVLQYSRVARCQRQGARVLVARMGKIEKSVLENTS